jgi:uncharacterized protein YacL
MFKSISEFNNTSDYLSILNGALITDLFVIFLLIFGAIKSKVLVEWYKKYNLSAVIADVLIIVIGIIIARFVYPYVFGESFSLIKFIGLAVLIQITHDILFYYMFKLVPRGKNMMLDTFKDYANEVGFKAVLSDSLMIISTCLLSSYFVSLNFNANIIILILSVYILPYAIYN